MPHDVFISYAQRDKLIADARLLSDRWKAWEATDPPGRKGRGISCCSAGWVESQPARIAQDVIGRIKWALPQFWWRDLVP